MFIIAIICFVIAACCIIGAFIARSILAGLIGGVLIIVGVFLTIFSAYYSQDPGEAKVLKDWTGQLVGTDLTEGASWKSPFVDSVDFDIRNQFAAFIGNGQDSYNGQTPTGPQITFQDKDGVSANLDLVVIYSIKPDAVESIYREYLNQDNFRARVIEQDIRSVPRNIASKYPTLELLNGREAVATAIREALETKWADKGILVEDVSLQEIRYPDTVKGRFEEAQNARTEVEKAEAELAKAKVDAQQKVALATAEAEANRILAESLTPQILQQRYYDVLGKANLIVVPEGFTALGNLGAVPQ